MGAMDGVAVQEARIGRGLFARRAFRRNERILQIDGRIVRHEVLWKRGGVFADGIAADGAGLEEAFLALTHSPEEGAAPDAHPRG